MSVDVDCPECGVPLDIREDINEAEAWLPLRLDIPSCRVEIDCPECGSTFLVTKVDF